jgi:hypothetical protein
VGKRTRRRKVCNQVLPPGRADQPCEMGTHPIRSDEWCVTPSTWSMRNHPRQARLSASHAPKTSLTCVRLVIEAGRVLRTPPHSLHPPTVMHELGTFEDARSRVLYQAVRMLLESSHRRAGRSVRPACAIEPAQTAHAPEPDPARAMIVRAAEWQHGIATNPLALESASREQRTGSLDPGG